MHLYQQISIKRYFTTCYIRRAISRLIIQIKKNCMKVLLLALLIISAFSLSLQMPKSVVLNDSNNQLLLQSDSSDQINYKFQGLPEGFQINNRRIVYKGRNKIEGQYPVSITAVDEKGDSDKMIVMMDIKLSGANELERLIREAANQFVRIPMQNSGSASGSGSSSSSQSSSSSSSGFISGSSGSSDSNSGMLGQSGSSLGFLSGSSSSSGSSGSSGSMSGSTGSITINQGTTSSQSESNVNRLIAQYNTGLTSNVLESKTIVSYPVPNVIITGNLPNQVPNTQIITITSAQADRTNSGVKKLTQYDTSITTLFNQQTQIGHTIGNLLEIIRQGSLNRQKLQVDIESLTKRLNSQVTIQQEFSLTISTEENKVKNLQSAITNANDTLNKLNANLNGINDRINMAKTNGLQLTQKLSNALNNQDGLKNQISGAKESIARITLNIKSSGQVCNDANNIIFKLNGNVSDLRLSISGVDQKVSGIDSQINDYERQVAALQAQINALNGKISSAKIDRQTLINLNFTVPQQIANLNAQILFQQQRCSASGGNQVDLKIVQDNLAIYEKKLLDTNNDVNSITTEISIIKSQLQDLINQSATLNGQIMALQDNINTLRQQLPNAQNNLNRLYVEGNRGLQILKSTNQSLGAAVIRFKRQSDALAIANLNLQQARSQQEKIRQSINLILQQNTAGLPFPSAPLSTGFNSTIDLINNIDSIRLYLLNAYGSTFQFENYYKQFLSVSKLYRFGSYNGNLMSNCGLSQRKGDIKLLSAQGKIIEINGDQIKVNNSEGDQKMNLDECSIRLSNIDGYNYHVGDMLVWKGYYDQAQRSWDVAQLTCFS